jgi:hypothetical protein
MKKLLASLDGYQKAMLFIALANTALLLFCVVTVLDNENSLMFLETQVPNPRFVPIK